MIADIKKAKLDITIEGDIQDFLGVNINRKEDGTIEFTQPHLIDKIMKAVRLGDEGKNRATPAKVGVTTQEALQLTQLRQQFSLQVSDWDAELP